MATKRLFDLLPPVDVGDPEAFLDAVTATFTGYPLGVLREAIVKIVQRSDRPTLKLIKEVCDEVYEPILRREQHQDRERMRLRSLPAPVDRSTRPTLDQIEQDLNRKIGEAGPKFTPRPSDDLPIMGAVHEPRADGKHALRVAADLEGRRARKTTEV